MLGSQFADVTWLERELIPGRQSLERFLAKPLVFDVDDAIWLGGPYAARGVERIARRSAVVLAGNSYIAGWLSQFAVNVEIVPTAVDTARFRPSDARADGPLRIGWTGIASNLTYLYAIEQPLNRFLQETGAEITIIAERPPEFRCIRTDRVRFVPWSTQNESDALREIDVGLMPLSFDEWARGKCSFKMLQYMASGIPVVVTDVGMNSDLLRMGEVGFGVRTEEEWLDALMALHVDRDLRLRLGRNGRALAVTRFDTAVIAARLLDLFRSVSTRSLS
ncbi:MAG: glycosyltransferase [Thermoanaerobaculia bacterium]